MARPHVPYECHCNRTGCMFCDGGLFACTTCGNLEGSLPSECPGVDCYRTHGDAIYAGLIDFRADGWVSRVPGYTVEVLVAATPAERVAIAQQLRARAVTPQDRAHAEGAVRITTWKEEASRPTTRGRALAAGS